MNKCLSIILRETVSQSLLYFVSDPPGRFAGVFGNDKKKQLVKVIALSLRLTVSKSLGKKPLD